MSDQSAYVNEFVQALRSQLDAYGWRIEPDLDQPIPSIILDHDLTTPHTVILSPDRNQSGAALKAVLESSEFQLIAKAPRSLAHAKLLRALREAAAAQSWDEAVLKTIASVLESTEIITAEEAEWFRDAGLPWV